jgi:hypothetical protein
MECQKPTWGGKRAGAGRKRDPHSQRAFCGPMTCSAYLLRQGKKIREFDAAWGTDLVSRLRSGELKAFQARRIAAVVIAQWEAEGCPENYDATWANTIRYR